MFGCFITALWTTAGFALFANCLHGLGYLVAALSKWTGASPPTHGFECIPFLQRLLSCHQLTPLGDRVVRWSPMEAANDDRLALRAILGSGELVVKLLWLIDKPSANRLVGEFFSDEFAPWERSLIDRSDGFFRR